MLGEPKTCIDAKTWSSRLVEYSTRKGEERPLLAGIYEVSWLLKERANGGQGVMDDGSQRTAAVIRWLASGSGSRPSGETWKRA